MIYLTGLHLTKRMKNSLLLFGFVVLCFSNVFAQNLNWVKQVGTWSNDFYSRVSSDNQGNIFISGCIYDDTLSIDGNILIGPNSTSSLFVVKCDSSTNNIVWAVFYPTTSGGKIDDLCIDRQGNCILTGVFYDQMVIGNDTLSDPTFDPTSFLISINAGGTLNWYNHLSSTCELNAKKVTTDDIGNIYTCGRLYCNGQFDTISINTIGYENFYIAKFSNSGNVLWVKNGTGKRMLTLDYSSAGVIRACTQYFDSLSIDNVTIYSNSPYENSAIVELDTSGYLGLVKNLSHSISVSSSVNITGLSTDAMDNVFISGSFDSAVVFIDSTLSSYQDNDIFILKLYNDGFSYSLKRFGGVHNDLSYSMVTDDVGVSYLCGSFEGAISFDGSWYFTAGSKGAFVCRVDSALNAEWVLNSDNNLYTEAFDLSLTRDNKLILTGTMNGPLDWGSWNLNTFGLEDIWIASISDISMGESLTSINNAEKLQIFPVPASDKISIYGLPEATGIIEISDLHGKIIYSSIKPIYFKEIELNLIFRPGFYLVHYIDHSNTKMRIGKLIVE